MENVPELCESDPQNVTWLSEEIKKLGYVLVFDILNSNSWGLPQSRRRFWAVCLHSERLGRSPSELEDVGMQIFALQRGFVVQTSRLSWGDQGLQ